MRRRAAKAPVRPLQAATALVLVGTLAAAVTGGLLRAGIAWPNDAAWAGHAAIHHAALIMSGFLGTVIGIERAVALKARWAWLAPLASLVASVLLLNGQLAAGALLYAAASAVFVGVNVLLVSRQSAPHTWLLLISAIAWLVGNLHHAAGTVGEPVHAWWFAFLVITIAAERLEMTRLMRRHPAAQHGLMIIIASLVLGAALSAAWPRAGGLLYGGALFALASWLGLFDIARRTALTHGLSRYMAVCLLCGYAWLAAAGLAWAAMSLGAPTRDLALHALGLGFIIGMVMGHAPAILPAVARVKLHYGAWFYAPLALLQVSLLLRLAGGALDPAWRTLGASLNAWALALFAATVAGSAIAWRVRHGARPLTQRTR